MSKYNAELKLEIVKEVLEKNKTVSEVSKKYCVHKSNIQKWITLYREHGVLGIERPKMTYTGEFKQTVVEDMRNNELSMRETAAKYNIGTHNVISAWERLYLEEGVEALYIERRGRACIDSGVKKGRLPQISKKIEEDLISENQRLRMENAYLKKLNALVKEKSHTEIRLK